MFLQKNGGLHQYAAIDTGKDREIQPSPCFSINRSHLKNSLDLCKSARLSVRTNEIFPLTAFQLAVQIRITEFVSFDGTLTMSFALQWRHYV
ncbi:MAG TPA: hypothetical protein DCW74_11700 [Alteromonas australica]|uniref:Uncharacterized protein n=1 Tax=Alteromonas australica TaxID=589873 RepID=A0A075NY63_9ALTE|nr:hypothetical protein EP13_06545 [Alteromonas australica]MAB94251.1 hypothetical protein [Alteromonas sp.]MAF71025.1 hypothetical protein [Alteromonas sp.]MAO28817.1 hypothetical protein [Alteromonas sp.]MBU35087.1 hypothetical protein [Alteromonas sp.]